MRCVVAVLNLTQDMQMNPRYRAKIRNTVVDDSSITLSDDMGNATTLAIGESISHHTSPIKLIDTMQLIKAGLLADTGDIYHIRKTDAGKILVNDNQGKKVTVLRNTILHAALIRLLHKYNTSFLRIKAI